MINVTVVRGDSLWALAARYLNDPYRWPELFRLNETAILAEQSKRRWYRPAVEDWIFPGTVLRVPV